MLLAASVGGGQGVLGGRLGRWMILGGSMFVGTLGGGRLGRVMNFVVEG